MTPTVELHGKAEVAEHCGEGPEAVKVRKTGKPKLLVR